MILKSILSEIVDQQKQALSGQKNGAILREDLTDISFIQSHNLVITGVRRCGKSTLMRQLLNANQGHYFNFEDPRTADFELSDFDRLEEVLGALADYNLFFFDEIQNVPQWERYIRSAHDRGLRFVLTGSNASLLSRELGTKLTGRYVSKELFPFSFSEFTKLQNKTLTSESFDLYLKAGGFPDFVISQNPEILHQLFRDVVNRDIIVRHALRQPQTITDLALYLLSNVGKKFSYNRLAKTFEIKSVNTAINYVSFLEDAYLIFTIPKFSYSLKKQQVNQKKVYAIDTGFIHANTLSSSEDMGRILENLVFLALRRKYAEIYYFEEDGECDFIVKEKGTVILAVQVCHELTEQNMKREFRGLTNAKKATNVKDSLLLTMNQEDEINGVKVLPVWKWLVS